MWHVYNLVREGDQVTATTFRKVAKDTGTGAESERVKVKLTVQVEGIEFDPEGAPAAADRDRRSRFWRHGSLGG